MASFDEYKLAHVDAPARARLGAGAEAAAEIRGRAHAARRGPPRGGAATARPSPAANAPAAQRRSRSPHAELPVPFCDSARASVPFRRKLLFESRDRRGATRPQRAVPVAFRFGDAADLDALAAPEYQLRRRRARLRSRTPARRRPPRHLRERRTHRLLRLGDVRPDGYGHPRVTRRSRPTAPTPTSSSPSPIAAAAASAPPTTRSSSANCARLGYRRVLGVGRSRQSRLDPRPHPRRVSPSPARIWHVRFLFRSYPILRGDFARPR